MKKIQWVVALLFTAYVSGSPAYAQQLRQMTRSGAALGDSSLTLVSDTLTSKTTFATAAASLAQVRKALSKFSFDSLKTGNLRLSGLTAFRPVFTDGLGGLVSNTITGTGNVVMSAGATLTGTTTVGQLNISSGASISAAFDNAQINIGTTTGASRIARFAASGSTAAGFGTNIYMGVNIFSHTDGSGSIGSRTASAISFDPVFDTARVTGAFVASTLAVSGLTTFTQAGGQIFGAGLGGTANIYGAFSNTSGALLFGVEDNAGGSIIQSSTAYDAVIRAGSALSIGTTGASGLWLRMLSTGATFSKPVTHSSTTVLSGALTYGGVTLSNAVTGTGNMVLSASPTLTGTVAAAAATFSSTTATTGDATFSGKIRGLGAGAGFIQIRNNAGTTYHDAVFRNTDDTFGFDGSAFGSVFNGTLKTLSGFTATTGTFSGAINGQTISSAANFTGNVTLPSAGFLYMNGGTSVYLVNNSANRLSFGASSAEVMRIDGGVGLTVTGAIASSAGITATLPAEVSTQSAVCVTSGGVFQANAAATCTVSARRFKRAITSFALSDALNITTKLRPVAYEEIGSGRKAIGVIAEEADSVDHRLATRDAKGQITSVNYEEITVSLLKVVQDQQKQIADLQARVLKLEKKKP